MAAIQIRENRLVASGILGPADFTAFERGCRDCLTQTQGDLLLDFSGVEHMTSAYVGALLELLHSLAERGRTMSIRASPAVARLVQITGLEEAMRLL